MPSGSSKLSRDDIHAFSWRLVVAPANRQMADGDEKNVALAPRARCSTEPSLASGRFGVLDRPLKESEIIA